MKHTIEYLVADEDFKIYRAVLRSIHILVDCRLCRINEIRFQVLLELFMAILDKSWRNACLYTDGVCYPYYLASPRIHVLEVCREQRMRIRLVKVEGGIKKQAVLPVFSQLACTRFTKAATSKPPTPTMPTANAPVRSRSGPMAPSRPSYTTMISRVNSLARPVRTANPSAAICGPMASL